MVAGGTAQPCAASPTCFCTHRVTASDQERPASATTGSIAARIFAAASRIALPLINVVRLATVGPLSGTREVSASTTWTRSTGQPRLWAAIWESTV